MKVCKNGLDKNILELFTAPFDDHDFFLHATHFVTVEQALATIGMLNPDFFEIDGYILWKNSQTRQYIEENRKIDEGKPRGFKERQRMEHFLNLFEIGGHFKKWEEWPPSLMDEDARYKKDIELMVIFAHQIEKYWRMALNRCFPDRKFEFEISADGLEGELGVCLTFWQAQ